MVKRNPTLSGRLTERQLDLVVRQIDRLPIAPPVGRALLALVLEGTDLSGPRQQRMLELAGLDISLTTWALRGRSDASPTQSAQASAAGTCQKLRTLVLSASLAQLLESPPQSRLDYVAFWRHSVAVAVASREIARGLSLPLADEEAFACGLLHDLGKLAMDASLPKSYARVLKADPARAGNIALTEQELLGVDHTVFGRRLAAHWRLPTIIESVIWMHHQDPAAFPSSLADAPMIAAVGLADAVARKLELGFSGNYTMPRGLEPWAAQIGLPAERLAALLRDLPDLVARQLAGLEMLGDAGPSAGAIAREVIRDNRQLSDQHEALAAKARAFDVLSGFMAGVSEETSVARVLAQIARGLAGESPEALPVVAYSLDAADAEPTAMLCRCDGGDDVTWRTLNPLWNDFSSAPAGARAAAGMLAGHDDLGDWLDLDACCHRPILCGGRWVGGVFLPQSAPCDQPHWQSMLSAMGMALGIVQGQSRAIRMSEELSMASHVLTETHQALAEAQTISTIGQMAAGAAHEINNPLAVISGRAQLMLGRATTDEDRKLWGNLVQQSQRISDIITDLMNFAAPPPPKPASVPVRGLFESAINLFTNSLPAQAASLKTDIEVEDSLPGLYVDRQQLESVLVELLTNATSASPSGVHVRLSAVPADQGQLLLTVEDDGPGMDDQTLARVFTPFFSAQIAGRRRGLGLARVRRWVEINGGRVQLMSRPGQGTRVLMHLPARQTRQP